MVTRRAEDLWLEVGRIQKRHGLSDQVFVFQVYSGDLNFYQPGRNLRLVTVTKQNHLLTLETVRPFKKGALITFQEDLTNLAAEKIEKACVYLRRNDLPPLTTGEIYLQDLLGIKAILPNGQEAGTVTSALETGAGLSLVIEGPVAGVILYHRDWVEDPDFIHQKLQLKQVPIS